MTPNPLTTASDPALERRARRRVGLKMGFLVHLSVYVLVNAGLLLLSLGRGGPTWQLYPLAGWGLGLAIHGLVTLFALKGEGVRERMLATEIERLQGRR
jgi:hypothetical protein